VTSDIFCTIVSGLQLILPQLIQPASYYIQITWNRIFLTISHYKNSG